VSKAIIDPTAQAELDLGDQAAERNLLDRLLSDSKRYQSSQDYQDLLDFIIRLRNMAPFNAMLLQIQKPGLSYAASEYDWEVHFERKIKDRARPLLIMWPFGPVALVYDLLDTDGPELPKDAFAFYAKGAIDEVRMETFKGILYRKQIHPKYFDHGDKNAGYICRLTFSEDKKVFSKYELGLNKNHSAAQNFATLIHELGHLFLGHLGEDRKLRIQDRRGLPHRQEEIEAESIAYIICRRNDIECSSPKYLHGHVNSGDRAEHLDLYAITRAAGHIERLLQLSRSSEWFTNTKI